MDDIIDTLNGGWLYVFSFFMAPIVSLLGWIPIWFIMLFVVDVQSMGINQFWWSYGISCVIVLIFLPVQIKEDRQNEKHFNQNKH